MPFRFPVDIANRGCQHLGANRISETEGFTEDSKQASAMSFAYDKLRRAELQANLWTFSTRKVVLRPLAATTLAIAPALWASTTTYRPGAIVSDDGNTLWISNFPENLNNAPGSSYFWEVYTGPLTADVYDSGTTYFAGELVYKFTGDGTYQTYLSLQNSNSDDPATGTAYDATATYMKDQIVTYASVAYISLMDLNKGNTPTNIPLAWAIATTYTTGQSVAGTDGLIYTSVGNGNVGNNPVTDGGTHWTNTGVLKPWTSVFTSVGGTGSSKWLQITPLALGEIFIQYPIGAGPSTQESTRNVYRLPAGYLRMAPQDPKAGAWSPLGASSALQYSDWDVEGNFIISHDALPIVVRAVFDIQDVSAMHDLFCEGLAARMALETCEEITQSTGKKQAVASEYNKFMTLAARTNAIELGAIEPPEDDLLACRV